MESRARDPLSSYVRLSSYNGDWSHYVAKKDDKVFRDLVPDLPSHLVPNELKLSKTISLILEEELPHYVKLIDSMKKLAPSVKLNEISHISLLLQMPADWHFFVDVSHESSEKAILDHLFEMGRVARQDSLISYYLRSDEPCIPDAIVQLSKPFKKLAIGRDDEFKDLLTSFHAALYRLCKIRSLATGDDKSTLLEYVVLFCNHHACTDQDKIVLEEIKEIFKSHKRRDS